MLKAALIDRQKMATMVILIHNVPAEKMFVAHTADLNELHPEPLYTNVW